MGREETFADAVQMADEVLPGSGWRRQSFRRHLVTDRPIEVVAQPCQDGFACCRDGAGDVEVIKRDQIYFISASTRHDNDIERCGVCGDIVECLEKPWDRSDSLDGSVENSGFKSVRTAVQDI